VGNPVPGGWRKHSDDQGCLAIVERSVVADEMTGKEVMRRNAVLAQVERTGTQMEETIRDNHPY